MGLGKFAGGLDSAVFAACCGAKVLVTDLSPREKLTDALSELAGFDNIEYRLGEHLHADFESADIVIVNPAVRPENEFLATANDAGALLTSQIEIFFQMCDAPIVGITGANGKSTTTSITRHLLSAGDRNVWIGGNIGNKPLLSIAHQIDGDDIVVLEISSFQCEQLGRTGQAPHIAVITNLTPNHLDRHGTFEAYCAAKELLFANQSKPCVSIFNAEDETTSRLFDKYCREDGRDCFKYSAEDVSADLRSRFKLAGRMNLSNLAAGLRVASCFDVPADRIAEAVASFKALPDRLELVADIDGVKWYNDSISTTPVSTMAALEAFDQPRIIIAGGYDKGLPFDELGKLIAKNAKAAVLIGAVADKIARCIGAGSDCNVTYADTMEDAVKICAGLAEAGDVVLMSPACASYDMFQNYKHRAKVFIDCVNKLNN